MTLLGEDMLREERILLNAHFHKNEERLKKELENEDPMDRLTDEILLIIFSNLDTINLLHVRQVDRRCRVVCNDCSLYRRIGFKSSLNISSKMVHTMCCQHKSKINSIFLTDCFWITSNQLANSLQHCSNLKELILIGSKLSMKGLCKVFSNNQNITRLGWSIPNPIQIEFHKRGQVFIDIQNIFKRLTGILLRFDSLNNFESFLPIFDTNDIIVNEFGLEYLNDRTSSYFALGNIYKMYVKCLEKFQICLKAAIDVNRFLHFNLLVTDFIMQTVSKAAQKHNIVTLLAPGNTNSLCWKYISSVLDILSYEKVHLSSATLSKQQITWLSKLRHLTHLNLSNVISFKANLMRAIATNCPNLQSLNLSHTNDWIDKELHGLESIASSCLKMSELNLSSLHIHSDIELNKLSSIISKMTNLKTLSLPSCGLVNNITYTDNIKDNNKSLNLPRHAFGFKPVVTSSLALSVDSSSSNSSDSSDFTNYITRKVRLSQEEDSLTEQTGSGLDSICCTCLHIEELEIINTGFNSAFSRPTSSDHKNFCPLSSQLKDKIFCRIGQLKYLKKLTFAGLSGLTTFSSLQHIGSSCEMVEELSIAYCGLSGHAGNLSALQLAIPYFKNLKRFRFDQPHFIIRDNFLEAFYCCKRLQVLCMITKNGKAPKNPGEYVKLFTQCPHLAAFFLFNGFTLTEAKNIQTKISQLFRYRHSLCVSVLPYFNALTEEGLRNVPYIYLRDIIRFESHVAVSSYDAY